MNRLLLIAKLPTLGLLTAGLIVMTYVFTQTPQAQVAPAATQIMANMPEITVFRSASCGCCGQWVKHLQTAGFQVKETVTEDLASVKQEHHVPANLGSCHTAIGANYVIEGHIPATDVQRLFTEKPNIAGIAVPGMPIGSPGMESGDYVEAYTVFSFDQDGTLAAFAQHP